VALPRQHRLRGERAFDRLYRKGRRYESGSVVLRLVHADPALLPPTDRCQPPSDWRCGVVVSSKVSKRAVKRNRLRRLLHGHLLTLEPRPPEPVWLLLSLRPGSERLPPRQLLGECTEVLRQAGLTS
jgi:ribonuclease P protein component